MEKKTARLTILIDPDKKQALETLCQRQDLTPSQVIRQLIREYLQKHGVEYASQTAATDSKTEKS
ncbi:ribbon-helix-helix domain-containing protein [Klebsiella sp. BIGb0407]|uniref:ribbon-helix-helix domain-containing protein n=1 Tax=Klebsiella sp. BIGb0407 TaxID=2940603 RepID=UPI002168DE44|nr:ribbon-helix-helix domain-containing protein [Klebsiella sp. BIGb0407]MCS3429875.1 putative transcriptional regulator [Klebsiella sp. BIGb0407]